MNKKNRITYPLATRLGYVTEKPQKPIAPLTTRQVQQCPPHPQPGKGGAGQSSPSSQGSQLCPSSRYELADGHGAAWWLSTGHGGNHCSGAFSQAHRSFEQLLGQQIRYIQALPLEYVMCSTGHSVAQTQSATTEP